MVELLTFKVNSITFENKVPNGTEIKLAKQFSYNVNYFGDDKRCLGKLDFRINDEDLRPFSIRVEMEALFKYDDDDEREDIHTESFEQLFPFLRQIIHSTTAMSGVPGLIIPAVHIDKSNVKVADKAGEEESSPLN